MTTSIVLLLSLLALSSAQQQFQQPQQSSTGCSFQSARAPYTLNWVVDSTSQNVFFNLTYRNFPQGSFTGVGFGDSMAAGLDVILVTLPPGTTTPQVIDASVKGYTQPSRDSNSEVQTRAASWIGGTLNAQFIRPLNSPNSVDKSLSGCVTWNFISSPGGALADGSYSKHSAAPEQQQQCNLATRCQGTIPAQFINTPNNGAWSNQNNNNNNNNNQNAFYSPYPSQNQQQFSNQQQQQYGQMNAQSYNPNQQFNQQQQYGQYNQQPYQTQPMNQPPYQGQQFQGQQYPGQQNQGQQFNQPPYSTQQFNPQPGMNQPYSPNQIGNGVQQQQPYYSPYGNQNAASSTSQQYGRKKRQANTNIYGYNYDSNAGSGPLIVQNPNYQFLPNYLADEYARTYSQASAQYDAQNGGANGAQRDPSLTPATQAPVLTNQQQNQRNYQQIQRDSASGAYSTIAPATNIYGYNYNTPSSSGLTSPVSPSSSSSAASRQFDSPANQATNSVSQRDQSLQRFYNPGVTSVGNVYTGSLYNGGATSGFNSGQPNNNGVFYNPSSTSGSSSTNGLFFDPNGNNVNNNNNNNGVFIASANRGPQPGQIVYYDTQNVGRKKRSIAPIRTKRQVRFFDPGNNQSAMYYPYRTETDFNLNGGQRGFSQVGGSPQYSAPNYNGVNGGVNNAPGSQRYYDTSRGVYVDNVPQYDSRGGNQYLKTAPVNPQSPNFVQTLQNNARALNDYVDSSCSKQDPYWCQSYVDQIMQAQNSFGSYTSGLCNTLVASLQYSDNRCCNAVRAAGCQSK